MMNNVQKLLHHPLSRALSLLVALVISVIILMLPQLLTNADGHAHHGLLALLMLGVSISFIHGVGFIPQSRIFHWLFSPVVGWTLISYCALSLWG